MLLEKIANFENLCKAFDECSQGKRSKCGYRNFIFNYGEKLLCIEDELMRTGNYKWGAYRKFYVHDPKKRLVMAAPFRDRIVHTAMHRILEPQFDKTLGCRTFACRVGKGNRNAVVRLNKQLKEMGKDRYCVKLDVSQYFASIDHAVLYENFTSYLSDKSINPLIWSLLNSFPKYAQMGKGIPIGNLTSQLFANFYLSKLDQLATSRLGIKFHEDLSEKTNCYIRYMDDMVIISQRKADVIETANDPVPFLGFLVNGESCVPLRRNERKFVKKMNRLKRKGEDYSYRAQVLLSYEAWQKLPI